MIRRPAAFAASSTLAAVLTAAATAPVRTNIEKMDVKARRERKIPWEGARSF